MYIITTKRSKNKTLYTVERDGIPMCQSFVLEYCHQYIINKGFIEEIMTKCQ